MRILVAEDDNVSRLVLTTGLRKLGYDVDEAMDGLEAWRLFKNNSVHLVITDWMMPNVDGLELCRRIRSEQVERYTFIIMLTALGGKQSYLEAMDAGADDFVTKPYDFDQIQAKLRMATRILKLQHEVKQLEGLLPICSYCKKIRNEDNTWESVEGYVTKKTDAAFSHGVCPSCYDEFLKPKMEELRRQRTQGKAETT